MRKLLFLLVFSPLLSNAQLVTLKAGMKLSSSVKVNKQVYLLNANADMQTPVIEITGENITVDFNDAILKGSNDKQMPDEFYGLAILIRDGKNITVKNLHARGYKVAILARNVEKLTVENCNLSYNYRQHLNSTQEKEDLSDWMSYHQNEKDEWLRYGAAVYLRNCNKANIKNNIVTGGQCALMMTLCNDGMVATNNFSYNSGIGIGMYRSSGNQVVSNKLDFNVRGHSEGIYNRGQDSAAILVFEQCNNNIFTNNSATHSGDGFFLWAGQTTMDSGQGGCNDNVIFRNDFSYAPTNGIEVTFSRNVIVQNTMVECDNGIWGGYSYSTTIKNNRFAYNKVAIAIEHGQEDTIDANEFQRNKESIKLWARKSQPADWGYAQKRDTRSRDYMIASNSFSNDTLVFNFVNTSGVRLAKNLVQNAKQVYRIDSITSLSLDTTSRLADWERRLESSRDTRWSFKRDRHNIRITEWGPYDFRSPLAWRTNPLDTSGLLTFELIGPKGSWKLISSRGVSNISKTSGQLPDKLTARKLPNHKGDIFIELEYTGEKVITPFGDSIAAGKPYRFAFRDARIPMQWQVKWFGFNSTTDPITDPKRVNELQQSKPFQAQEVKELNFAWWGGINAGGKQFTQFLTIAESEVDLEPGEYELSVTWDDAARVQLDGRYILNEWNPSLYKFDESPNKRLKLKLGGHHTFRVEHVELGGFATISLRLKKL